MIFNSISRHRSTTILILAVFSIVIVLFSGYHSMNVMGGIGTSHQSNTYSCLFTICVAIFTVFTLFTLLLSSTTVFDPILIPKSEPLFLLEKPPRG